MHEVIHLCHVLTFTTPGKKRVQHVPSVLVTRDSYGLKAEPLLESKPTEYLRSKVS